MSFPRAKRFNYKHPDFSASPADYYITSNFGSSSTIPKCSRPLNGNDHSSLTGTRCQGCSCSRCPTTSTRYVDITSFSSRSSLRGIPKAFSTPQKSYIRPTHAGKMKGRASFFNRNDIKNCSFREKSHKQFVEPSNRNKQVEYLQEPVRTMPFWAADEFIDDDYHSYTSSEELDSLKRFPQQTDNDLKNRNFEMSVLKQMEMINMNIQKFQIDLKELKDDMRMKNICDKSQIASKSDGVKYIIHKAIEKLRSEFESTQNVILSQTLKRINLIAQEIRSTSKLSKNKIDNLCGEVASELIESIFENDGKDDTLEIDVSNGCEVQLEKIDNILSPNLFSYEKVCKLLSEHLQVSRRELDDLNEDKSSIKRKFGSAKKAIDAQSTIIKNLHKNLAELKNTYKK